jgi:hypothetical protein
LKLKEKSVKDKIRIRKNAGNAKGESLLFFVIVYPP